MKAFLLVNPGIELIAVKELKELIQVKGKINPSVVEFDATPAQLAELSFHCQSARRIALFLGCFESIESFPGKEEFSWEKIIAPGTSIKIEVENVKGQDNRFAIAKTVMGALFSLLEKNKLPAVIDLKKPNLLLVVFQSAGKYYFGLDLCGKEINARAYRLFPHSASFKGDSAYAIVRTSGYIPSEKLVIGFVKDGTLAIEATLFSHHLPCRNPAQEHHSWLKFPLFEEFLGQTSHKSNSVPIPFLRAFDESKPNTIAAQKNSRLAKVSDHLFISRHSLDELDTRYSPEEFDRAIFHLTSKDEEKINELYYQLKYILKPHAQVLLLSRSEWKPPESSTLTLVSETIVPRGEGAVRMTLLEKK